MARLQIRHSDRSIGEGRTARVVRLSGSIDTSTVARFDAEVGEALIGATRLAVMLFTEVEYVNSRGMALLVKYHDVVGGSGGLLVLAEVPASIASTLEVMGLTDTLVVEPDLDAALARLERHASGGATDESAPPRAEGPASFPVGFACDTCRADLVAETAGKYRCPRCQSCFEVTDEGKILPFAARSARSVDVTFPCRSAYAEAARALAAGVAKDAELSSITSELLDQVIDEVVGLYSGKAGETDGRLRMFVAADSQEVIVSFFAHGARLALTAEDQEGMTFKALRGIADEIEIVPLEPNGHVLKLVKKAY